METTPERTMHQLQSFLGSKDFNNGICSDDRNKGKGIRLALHAGMYKVSGNCLFNGGYNSKAVTGSLPVNTDKSKVKLTPSGYIISGWKFYAPQTKILDGRTNIWERLFGVLFKGVSTWFGLRSFENPFEKTFPLDLVATKKLRNFAPT